MDNFVEHINTLEHKRIWRLTYLRIHTLAYAHDENHLISLSAIIYQRFSCSVQRVLHNKSHVNPRTDMAN